VHFGARIKIGNLNRIHSGVDNYWIAKGNILKYKEIDLKIERKENLFGLNYLKCNIFG